jgi:dsDNA-specific endonuclease/ATPase MutS2
MKQSKDDVVQIKAELEKAKVDLDKAVKKATATGVPETENKKGIKEVVQDKEKIKVLTAHLETKEELQKKEKVKEEDAEEEAVEEEKKVKHDAEKEENETIKR